MNKLTDKLLVPVFGEAAKCNILISLSVCRNQYAGLSLSIIAEPWLHAWAI